MSVDDAFKVFQRIRSELENYVVVGLSETDTRCKMIDTILIDVLGWKEIDIERETCAQNGYVDYLLRSGDRNVMVIEAKRSGTILSTTKQTSLTNFKISGPALKQAKDAFEQARKYCYDHSVGYAAITSGSDGYPL